MPAYSDATSFSASAFLAGSVRLDRDRARGDRRGRHRRGDLLLGELELEVALDLGRLVVDRLVEVDRVDEVRAALEVEAEVDLLVEVVPGRQRVAGEGR
jgi:hypothetical protein